MHYQPTPCPCFCEAAGGVTAGPRQSRPGNKTTGQITGKEKADSYSFYCIFNKVLYIYKGLQYNQIGQSNIYG